MHILQHVNPNYVAQLWPQVEKHLEAAMKHSAGEYDLGQLKGMLVGGSQHLLVIKEGEEVVGALTIAFDNFPNDRIAFVTAVGGKLIASREGWKQLGHWCKANGCTKIRGAAHESVARLWRQRFNVQEIYRIVEITL